jgi:glyoxylase-like metal-dependent hydrolase (beta-lactamase superfamily II)
VAERASHEWGGVTVHTIPLGPIGTNCYIAHASDSDQCVVIDPGADAPTLIPLIEEKKLTPVAVLVTHCHWDHIGAVAPIARKWDLPVYMSRLEAPVLEDIDSFAPAQFGPYENHRADHLLDGGERLKVAGMSFEGVHLPGHSPGTIAFYIAGEEERAPILFCGDVIFQDSIGRYDIPFADGPTLFESLRLLLDRFADDTVLYPGHGPQTTIGRERLRNPFLRNLAQA